MFYKKIDFNHNITFTTHKLFNKFILFLILKLLHDEENF